MILEDSVFFALYAAIFVCSDCQWHQTSHMCSPIHTSRATDELCPQDSNQVLNNLK